MSLSFLLGFKLVTECKIDRRKTNRKCVTMMNPSRSSNDKWLLFCWWTQIVVCRHDTSLSCCIQICNLDRVDSQQTACRLLLLLGPVLLVNGVLSWPLTACYVFARVYASLPLEYYCIIANEFLFTSSSGGVLPFTVTLVLHHIISVAEWVSEWVELKAPSGHTFFRVACARKINILYTGWLPKNWHFFCTR